MDESSRYLSRWLEPGLAEAVADHPVLVLTGARQVGKSSLLLHAEPFRRWRYVTFDDLDSLALAEQNPEGLWAGTDRVVLDEVQKAPAVLSAVKRAVDRDRRRRFVLSGSANLLLYQRVSESLAGRAVYVTLDPMALGEMSARPRPTVLEQLLEGRWPAEATSPSPPDPWEVLQSGLMPALLPLRNPRAATRWWEGYVATYLERDLRQMSRVASLVDFRRVMAALALRTGQILNQTTIARECRAPQPTVHRDLNLLEATCLLIRLPGYARNRGKRLVKAPKLFWVDPGLAAFLAGFLDAAMLRQAREAGGFLEALVFHHLRILAQTLVPRPRFHHWRTAAGEEVDLVIEHGRRLLAVEVKATPVPRHADADGLRAFLDEHGPDAAGLLVHTGRETRRLDERIVAMPWTRLAGVP